MSLATLVNEPCTITPGAEGADEDGPGEAGDPFDELCYAEQLDASEDTVNATTQSQRWKVILFPHVTIDGHATIAIPGRGLELAVLGPPHPVRNPRTRVVHHLELTASQAV